MDPLERPRIPRRLPGGRRQDGEEICDTLLSCYSKMKVPRSASPKIPAKPMQRSLNAPAQGTDSIKCGLLKHYKKEIREIEAIKISSFMYIENLILRFCFVCSILAEKLLARNPKMPCVALDYSNIKDAIPQFWKCLTPCHTEKLSLMGCDLCGRDIGPLVKEICMPTQSLFSQGTSGTGMSKRQPVAMKSLRLTHNSIGTEGLVELTQLINQIKWMDKLHVKNCGLTDNSLIQFEENVAENKRINELNISQNKFTPDGMECLGRIAEKCEVRSLLITSCSLTDKHIESLTKSSTKVKNLSLAQNINISADAMIKLAKRWKNLEHVNLWDCEFETDVKERLQKALPQWKVNFIEDSELGRF